MIKLISYLFFTLSPITILAQQDNTKIKYRAPTIYFSMVNDKGLEVSRKIEGRDVLMFYDTLFRSYTITYNNSGNEIGVLILDYVMTLEDGSIKVTDKKNNVYYVLDFLKTAGKLKILYPKRNGDNVVWIIIDNAVKGN
jgi:hypothetical protein